jgi:hypothetical protein
MTRGMLVNPARTAEQPSSVLAVSCSPTALDPLRWVRADARHSGGRPGKASGSIEKPAHITG